MVERRPLNPWLARLWVFHFVVVGWIFFRAPDLGVALAYLWGLVANWGVGTLVTPTVLLALVAGWSVSSCRGAGATRSSTACRTCRRWCWRWGRAEPGRDQLLGPQGVAPFIYFQF